mmetsp:Transcript_41/g.112  ORF Transcript_41/g.112 Transcript_41/m.112 type:complete len:303 (-) Transcript_41:336-1244(-)
MSANTIARRLDATAKRFPSRMALLSPFQVQSSSTALSHLTYDDLSTKSQSLAGFLSMYGFNKGDILMSDLPNTSENLITQLACNRLGVGYGTVKNLEGMSKFMKVHGAISSTGAGFLAETALPLPVLSGEFLSDLISDGLDEFAQESIDVVREDGAHGYYNSTSPYTNADAIQHGEESSWELAMTEEDSVCVSVTLCHAFGIGSGVTGAILSGSTIVLPAVGGIQGCGVPSKRAEATLEVLESEKCTLLFADTHTLKALPDPEDIGKLHLRGGICKIGSGSTILEETRKYGGVSLKTMGKVE